MSNDLLALCLTEARRLASSYQWHLLPVSEWAEEALEFTPPAATDVLARRACLTVYSRILYAACQDGARRNQAYGELHRYLWLLAQRWDSALADDAAQRAIELIYTAWQQPDEAKHPRSALTFLRFAQLKLREAMSHERRVRDRGDGDIISDPLTDRDPDNDDFWDRVADPRPPIDADLIERESRAERAHWLAAMRFRVAHLTFGCLQRLLVQAAIPAQTIGGGDSDLRRSPYQPADRRTRRDYCRECAGVALARARSDQDLPQHLACVTERSLPMSGVKCAVDADHLLRYLEDPASAPGLPAHIADCRYCQVRLLAIASASQQGGAIVARMCGVPGATSGIAGRRGCGSGSR